MVPLAEAAPELEVAQPLGPESGCPSGRVDFEGLRARLSRPHGPGPLDQMGCQPHSEWCSIFHMSGRDGAPCSRDQDPEMARETLMRRGS